MTAKLTPTQAADVATRYQAGETTAQLAATYHVSDTTIGNYLRRANIPLRNGKGNKLTPARVARMEAAYQAGATTDELATIYGVHRATISRYLRLAGITPRGGKGPEPTLSPTQINQLVTDYQAGQTTRQLGAALNLSSTAISNYLRHAGIPARPSGRRRPHQHDQ